MICTCPHKRHRGATVDVVSFGEPLAPAPVVCLHLPMYTIVAGEPPTPGLMCGPCARWWRTERAGMVRDYQILDGLQPLQRLVCEVLWYLANGHRGGVDGAWATMFADLEKVADGICDAWGPQALAAAGLTELGDLLDGATPADGVAAWARTHGLWVPTREQLVDGLAGDAVQAEYRLQQRAVAGG
ncbi:hypothetical protein [Dactylosporangium sp. CS-033363]|uniref:hypothetical protein n=1 Tax=Dactylosporangium sp. CS-033363 TaxID=3239935 RepID=UPI003D8C167F